MSPYRLGDTIQIETYVGDTGDEPTFDTAVTIENVRFQRKSIIKDTGHGLQTLLKGKVFIDAVNSTNADSSRFTEGSIVYFDSEPFVVHEVREFAPQAGMGVRHWELVLK